MTSLVICSIRSKPFSPPGDIITLEDATMAERQGGPCDGGKCDTCDGSCGGEAGRGGKHEASDTVTITASALITLINKASGDEYDAARKEGYAALVASGFINVEAEREARLARLEAIAIDAVYDRED